MKDKTKILVLDEATSSVDEKTEDIMQSVIDKEFRAHTVIAVVHRLRYLESFFDGVVVLKGGEVVESGAPGELIRNASQSEGKTVFGELWRGFNQGHGRGHDNAGETTGSERR